MAPDREKSRALAGIAGFMGAVLTLSVGAPMTVHRYLLDGAENQRTGHGPVASFPYDSAADTVGKVTIVWLGLAVAAWLWCGWSVWRWLRSNRRST